MSSHEIKIIVSAETSIENLEEIFDLKSAGSHQMGGKRAGGTFRKQSIWTGRLTPKGDFIENSVEWALGWLSSKHDALKSLDPGLKIKICCKLYVSHDPNGFVVNPRMAKMLSDLDVLLLLDVDQDVQSDLGSPCNPK